MAENKIGTGAIGGGRQAASGEVTVALPSVPGGSEGTANLPSPDKAIREVLSNMSKPLVERFKAARDLVPEAERERFGDFLLPIVRSMPELMGEIHRLRYGTTESGKFLEGLLGEDKAKSIRNLVFAIFRGAGIMGGLVVTDDERKEAFSALLMVPPNTSFVSVVLAQTPIGNALENIFKTGWQLDLANAVLNRGEKDINAVVGDLLIAYAEETNSISFRGLVDFATAPKVYVKPINLPKFEEGGAASQVTVPDQYLPNLSRVKEYLESKGKSLTNLTSQANSGRSIF